MELFKQHLRNVHDCQVCPLRYGFSRSSNGAYYKFPPLIGAVGQAKILFVGINPRISNSNRQLHDRLIDSEESFHRLAYNRLDDESPYISLNAEEKHYHSHMLIVQGVFGNGCEFEKAAAVTELFLCASARAPTATVLETKSICAEKHLQISLSIIKPKVIVAVGTTAWRHLNRHFRDLLVVPCLEMEHPSRHFHLDQEEKRQRLRRIINEVRRIIG